MVVNKPFRRPAISWGVGIAGAPLDFPMSSQHLVFSRPRAGRNSSRKKIIGSNFYMMKSLPCMGKHQLIPLHFWGFGQKSPPNVSGTEFSGLGSGTMLTHVPGMVWTQHLSISVGKSTIECCSLLRLIPAGWG